VESAIAEKNDDAEDNVPIRISNIFVVKFSLSEAPRRHV